ncbi:ribosome biogenesis factor YjgA [Marinicella meishanensis]|uniref:ribosome biogenesis factor YjgA n=1 Tax=Marinicella meishanensis TaxID=2873263 RepID=UPI001CC14105|nr:ribosome biogenesis factor YjgA [Marinicella sp. NBU2979]
MTKDHLSDQADSEAVISKTKRKQMVHELKDLAKAICEMPPKKVAQLDLPEVFLQAMAEAKRITSHIARKRHFQYMGKLLLKADPIKIQETLAQLEQSEGHYQVRDAVINAWIELFAEHEKALFDHLYTDHGHDVINALRQTLRNHRRKPELAELRKKLFQALRKLDQQQELPNPQTLI